MRGRVLRRRVQARYITLHGVISRSYIRGLHTGVVRGASARPGVLFASAPSRRLARGQLVFGSLHKSNPRSLYGLHKVFGSPPPSCLAYFVYIACRSLCRSARDLFLYPINGYTRSVLIACGLRGKALAAYNRRLPS